MGPGPEASVPRRVSGQQVQSPRWVDVGCCRDGRCLRVVCTDKGPDSSRKVEAPVGPQRRALGCQRDAFLGRRPQRQGSVTR